MNIDSRVLTVLLFLVVQSATGVWWASNLSSEVERLAGIQGLAIPALEAEAQKCGIAIHNNEAAIKELQEHDKAISGLDVLEFKIDELRKEIASLREVDREIMTQHEKIFDWMAQSSPMQQKGGNPYN
jgi:TolA-binding protein|tara:strand:- start:356 stop:739 length:384 start_codon:yes stop_codon:yes gene_type:complete